MAMTPTTLYLSMCDALSHLIVCSSKGGAMLHETALENRVLGWAFGLGETWEFDSGMGWLGIVFINQHHNNNGSHC